MYWSEIRVLSPFVKPFTDASHHSLQLLFSLRSFLHLDPRFCSYLLCEQFNVSIWMSIRHLIHMIGRSLISTLSFVNMPFLQAYASKWMPPPRLGERPESQLWLFLLILHAFWEQIDSPFSKIYPEPDHFSPLYQCQPSASYHPVSFGSCSDSSRSLCFSLFHSCQRKSGL